MRATICLRILVLAVVTMATTWTEPCLAQADSEEDEDFFMELSRQSTGESVRLRQFAGSRDEGKLEVLAELPQPSRSPDASFALPTDADDRPETAPSTD